MQQPRLRDDVVWGDLMPSLRTAREVGRLPETVAPWLGLTPADAGAAGEISTVCRHIATVMLDVFETTSLGSLIPSLPVLEREAFPALPARANKVLDHILDAGDVRAWAPADIMDMRQIGRGSAIDVLAACTHAAAVWGQASTNFLITPVPDGDNGAGIKLPAGAGLELPAGSDLDLQAGAERDLQENKGDNDEAHVPNPVELNESQTTVLEDLRTLAHWQIIRGISEALLIKPVMDEGPVPEAVAQAQERLATLTAARIVPDEDIADAANALDTLIDDLSAREFAILTGRFLKTPPVTLDIVGSRLGVTRERVRQLQNNLEDKMRSWTEFGTPVGDFLAVLRAEIQPIAKLEKLISRHPNLSANVRSVNLPLWFVLDRLDDNFEVIDGWAAAPSIHEAQKQTRGILEDLEDRHGLVAITDFNNATSHLLDDELTQEWISFCGFDIAESHILLRTSSIPDRVVAILALAGEPMHIKDLISRLPDRSVSSIRNALGTDSRVSRVNRDLWALSEWGQENYTTIRELIARRLERAPQGVRLDTLVHDLTQTFNMAESSIRAYASAPPFMTVDGCVMHMEGEQAVSRKPPSQTRRLYRRGDEWIYRFTVTKDHLRGSGFTIPRGVADVMQCRAGDVLPMTSAHGPVTFRWTGTQPACGSIRGHLQALNAEVGDQALIIMKIAETSAEIKVLDSASLRGKGLDTILRLIGRDSTEGSALTEMVEALSLPAASDVLTVAQSLQDRGEEDLYEVVTQNLKNFGVGPASEELDGHTASEDELMDLLGL